MIQSAAAWFCCWLAGRAPDPWAPGLRGVELGAGEDLEETRMPGTGVVEERPAGHEDLPVREQGRGLVFASGGHAAGAGPGVGARVVEHGGRGGLRVRNEADEPAGD